MKLKFLFSVFLNNLPRNESTSLYEVTIFLNTNCLTVAWEKNTLTNFFLILIIKVASKGKHDLRDNSEIT